MLSKSPFNQGYFIRDDQANKDHPCINCPILVAPAAFSHGVLRREIIKLRFTYYAGLGVTNPAALGDCEALS